MDQNRRLAKLLGWKAPDELVREYNALGVWGDEIPVPDFAADPRLVLRAIIERDDWDQFWQKLFMEQGNHPNFWVYYMLNPSVLRDKAIEFLEQRKEVENVRT